MKRLRRVVILFALFVLILCIIGIGLLLTSEAALRWVFPRVAAWSGIELSVTQLHGRLIGPST